MKYIKLDDAIRAAESCTDSMEPISHDVTVELAVIRLKEQPTTEIVRCRDCMYSPSGTDNGPNKGCGLEWPHDDWPENNPCPCKCADGWYSHKPKPDFFCANGMAAGAAEGGLSMGVYIKGLAMPTGNHEITVRIQSDGRVLDQWGHRFNQELIAVPVPPHGRCIDADALTISTDVPLDGKPYQYVHIDNIKGAPTFIPAEEGE